MTSIVATPEPGFSPPRVRLAVTATAGTTLSAVEVRRDGRVLRQPVFPGGTTATVYDYEAPYGTPVTYTASGTTAGAYTNEWSESWASLANWTGDTSSWSVSGGKAASTVEARTIKRMALAPIGRVVLGADPAFVDVGLLDQNGTEVARLDYLTGYAVVRLWVGSSNTAATYAGGAATLTLTDGRVVARGSNWELSLPLAAQVRGVSVKSALGNTAGAVAQIGSVAVAPNSTTVFYSELTTATLAADSAWLVHPVQPAGRSACIGKSEWRPDGVNVSPESMATATRGSNAVTLNPVGRTGSVVISEGTRPRKAWSLILLTHRLEDLAALNGLLDDEQVLLLRSPAEWTWGHPDGWWAVGEASEDRIADHVLSLDRRVTLPLIPAEEPVVQQQPAWTWSDVMTHYATWADVAAAFETYSDLLNGPQ